MSSLSAWSSGRLQLHFLFPSLLQQSGYLGPFYTLGANLVLNTYSCFLLFPRILYFPAKITHKSKENVFTFYLLSPPPHCHLLLLRQVSYSPGRFPALYTVVDDHYLLTLLFPSPKCWRQCAKWPSVLRSNLRLLSYTRQKADNVTAPASTELHSLCSSVLDFPRIVSVSCLINILSLNYICI